MKLRQLIERYIAYRQALGEGFKVNAIILRAFSRAMGVRATVTVCPKQVRTFLDGSGPVTSSWHVRHNALAGFYRYAVSRGYLAASPLPAVLPQRPPPFVPYIYTRAELRRLLEVAGIRQHKLSGLEPATLRTILLLLYGTGLRVHEAVALDRADVDLGNRVLTVRRTKFYKTRLVPVSQELADVLARYVAGRPATPAPAEPAPLFTMQSGRRVRREKLEKYFRRVREQAGVRRTDGASYQPRLHDLRHTFAVHRLTSWYRQGADVQQLLPQLSVYLGHAHLASTQLYLSMTPELLEQANARFEHYAGKEEGRD